MHQSITLLTKETPVSPPPDESNGSLSLGAAEWVLKRFTGPGWTLASIEFSANSPEGYDILSATLSHESGSLIQCLPFDPEEHAHDAVTFTSHRVRLRDRERDEATYVTLGDESPTTENLIETLAGRDDHPYSEATNFCAFTSQSSVHFEDSKCKHQSEPRARGTHHRQVSEALLAILGAAMRVSMKSQQQTGLDCF